jgi:hypothetical protein
VSRHLDLVLTAKDSLCERDGQIVTEVLAALGSAPRRRTSSRATKKALKDVIDAKAKASEPRRSRSTALDASVPKAIVTSSPVLIAQYFVGLVDLFEPIFGAGFLVDVGMVFARQATISFLEFVRAGIARHAQYLVIVSLTTHLSFGFPTWQDED